MSAPAHSEVTAATPLRVTVDPVHGRGTVAFFDGTATIAGCTAQPIDAAGNASCSAAFAQPGAHAVHAAYAGIDDWLPSTSPATTVFVSAPTVLDVRAATVLPVKHTVQLSARLTTKSGASSVAGRTITFASLDNAYLCRAKTNADGVATCEIGAKDAPGPLAKGYAGRFAGDGLYDPSQGTAPSTLSATSS
ncbi:MAG TPA: Ig-like domain-containing protein [Acidimicrobiales bacterium]|nr:Ig-like domain-containing protein [Acidimicrobiales bacterium]